MIILIKKLFFIFIIFNFRSKKNLSYLNLNFRKLILQNYKQIKTFIFKKKIF